MALPAHQPDDSGRLIKKLQADIDERRVIERELAHLASFPEMDPNAIIETSVQGELFYTNPAAQDRFPDLPLMGKHHPLLEGLDEAIEVMQREHKPLMKRLLKIHQAVYEQQISLIDGGPRIRLYLTDVTELKKLERLKDDFVNMVSHELRTPLTAIKASVQMVAEGVMGDVMADQQRALSLALDNIDRLGRMINDLLDLSKMEAGKLELHRDQMDLAETIRHVIATHQPLFQGRGIELRVALKQETLPFYADRDKIIQIFSNLMTNALKFTERGWVELSASPDAQGILCVVSDTGRGIAPTDLPKVFEKFRQFGGAAVSGQKGTGLGLSICKGLIELHKGKIWVESKLGEGTRFMFTLPYLHPVDLFKEKAQQYVDRAVALEKPLSIFHFGIKNAQIVRDKIGAERYAMVMKRFEELVMSALRSDSDISIKDEESVYLILPSVDKSDAAGVAERIEQGFRDYSFQQVAETPIDIGFKIVSYPEDGKLLEQLLPALDL